MGQLGAAQKCVWNGDHVVVAAAGIGGNFDGAGIVVVVGLVVAVVGVIGCDWLMWKRCLLNAVVVEVYFLWNCCGSHC